MSEHDRAPSPRVWRGRYRGGGTVCEMVREIGELDNASQSTRWAECIGDPLHVEAVVVAFRARKKHQRAELDGAYPAGAQLADREVRALQDVVQPRSDTCVPGRQRPRAGGARIPGCQPQFSGPRERFWRSTAQRVESWLAPSIGGHRPDGMESRRSLRPPSLVARRVERR